MTNDGTDKQPDTSSRPDTREDTSTDQAAQPEQAAQQTSSQTNSSAPVTPVPVTPAPVTPETALSETAIPEPLTPTLWHDALGNLTERQLLRALAATHVSGTLWLERPQHCSLLLLAHGRTLVSFELANTAKSQRRVRLFAHASDETTLLPNATSRYPTSALPLLQALPDLPPEQHFSTASCDLTGVVQEQTVQEQTDSLLVIETVPAEDKNTSTQHVKQQRIKQQRAYTLFSAGELRDVSLERWSEDTKHDVLEGTEALDALLALEGHVTLTQWALAPFVIEGLLALRGERRDDSPPFLTTPAVSEQEADEREAAGEITTETVDTFDADAFDADAFDADAFDADVAMLGDSTEVTDEVLEPDKTRLDTTADATENIAEDAAVADTVVTDTAVADTVNEMATDEAELPEDTKPDTSAEIACVLEVSDAGYTFYNGHHACLHVPSTPVLAGGWYQAETINSIALPDATSHIVKKYYRLTLRGRDALSPMMELYNSVQKDFGNKGKDVLQALREPCSSHALLEVEPDPDVLEDLLRRLERASLIFELDPNSSDIDLSDVL